MTIRKLQDMIGKWGIETFPQQTAESIIAHLVEEVMELDRNPTSEEELADCMILLLNLAYYNKVNLVKAILDKHKINVQREWGERQENGVVHHIPPKIQQKIREEEFKWEGLGK